MKKLGVDKVREVRRLLETTPLTFPEIAEETGLVTSTIQRLSKKKTYNGIGWSKEAEFRPFYNTIVRHSHFTLTPSDAREIVRLYRRYLAFGKPRPKEIAGRYKVSASTIYGIVRGDIWSIATIHERDLIESMR